MVSPKTNKVTRLDYCQYLFSSQINYTFDPSQHCSHDTQKVCAMRWYIEQFHREIKQLTGVEKSESLKQRIQRNHIAFALLV